MRDPVVTILLGLANINFYLVAMLIFQYAIYQGCILCRHESSLAMRGCSRHISLVAWFDFSLCGLGSKSSSGGRYRCQ